MHTVSWVDFSYPTHQTTPVNDNGIVLHLCIAICWRLSMHSSAIFDIMKQRNAKKNLKRTKIYFLFQTLERWGMMIHPNMVGTQYALLSTVHVQHLRDNDWFNVISIYVHVSWLIHPDNKVLEQLFSIRLSFFFLLLIVFECVAAIIVLPFALHM